MVLDLVFVSHPPPTPSLVREGESLRIAPLSIYN